MLRDWSLITGRGGGATKQDGGGAREFFPLQKVFFLSMLKGGTTSFGVVFMW